MSRSKLNPKILTQKILSKIGLRVVRIPKITNPIAPFDLIELAVEREFLKNEGSFFFIHFGDSNHIPSLSLACAVRKFELRGRIVNYSHQTYNKFENYRLDQTQLDYIAVKRIDNEQHSPSNIITNLQAKTISLLSLCGSSGNKTFLDSIFDNGIFPPIINLDRSEMNLEQIYTLKMSLLDNGYRFIDVGTDTICLRIEHD